MNSPRYASAGLLVEHGKIRLLIDGGPGAGAKDRLVAWLVTDGHGELIHEIRKVARLRGLDPRVTSYSLHGLLIKPHSVVHTSHRTYGYTIEALAKSLFGRPSF
jgi:hypothetical protein